MRGHSFLKGLMLALAMSALAGCAAVGSPETGEGGAVPLAPEPTAGAVEIPEATLVPTSAPTVLPVLTESRRLNLEWPPRLREGDSGVVKMVLEVDDQGNITPTAQVEGNIVRGETVIIEDLYDTHNVVAEARLEMVGVEISPEGEIAEPLRPGQSATFFWSIRTSQVGRYKGTVWLHLRYIPLNGEGPEIRKMVSAQVIDVESVNFLGLGGTPARLLGGLGALVGSILGLDNVVSWVWGQLRKRSRFRLAG